MGEAGEGAVLVHKEIDVQDFDGGCDCGQYRPEGIHFDLRTCIVLLHTGRAGERSLGDEEIFDFA